MRAKITTYEQYKEEIMKSLENIQSNSEIMESVIKNFDKDC